MKNKLLLTLLLLAPQTAYAQGQDTPLGRVASFADLVALTWSYGSQVILALAIFFVILGGLFYVASAGNAERINQGKQMIFGSIVAVVIVTLSGAIIRFLHQPTEGTSGNLAEIPTVIQNSSNILVGIIGTYSIFMLIYGGIRYATAAGDPEKIEKAQSAIRYAILGLIIGLLAFAGISALVNFLGN